MKRKELVRIGAVSALAVISLSGCSTWHSITSYISSDNANVCPDAAILANTAILPAFDPAKGADPSGVAYNVTVTDVRTRCDYRKTKNDFDANVQVKFKATRPPGGEEAHYRVPYFVAVTTGGDIIDKQIHWLEFEFDKTQSVATAEQFVDDIHVDVAKQKHSYEYHLLVGFQLTQAQIDYNKKMGQYLP